MNSDDFYHVEELVVISAEDGIEGDLTYEIDEKATLDIPLSNLSEIPHLIVLVLRFKLQQELHNHITCKYGLKCHVNVIHRCTFLWHTKRSKISINKC